LIKQENYKNLQKAPKITVMNKSIKDKKLYWEAKNLKIFFFFGFAISKKSVEF